MGGILWTDEQYKATDRTDSGGNPILSVTNGHSVFSDNELAKLKEAERLIREVRDNYREEYFKMKSKIK